MCLRKNLVIPMWVRKFCTLDVGRLTVWPLKLDVPVEIILPQSWLRGERTVLLTEGNIV